MNPMIDEPRLVQLLAEQLPEWLNSKSYAACFMAIRRAVAEGAYIEHDDGLIEVSVMPGWSAYCRRELVA